VNEVVNLVSGQPLGIAVLGIMLALWLRRTIVLGRDLDEARARYELELERERRRTAEERARGDKLQETVDTLSAGLTKGADVARESLEIARLNTILMQSIDTALQRKGSR
jgi:hypothetical protein